MENKKVSFANVAVGFRASLLITVLAVPSASADSLNDALVKAYQTNPQLLSERANLRATDEEVAQAIALWRPTISVSSDFTRDTSNTKSDVVSGAPSLNGVTVHRRTDPWNAQIQATQTVFAGGRILAQRRRADAQVRAERARLVSTEQGVLLDTVTSYMNVVRDDATVKLNQTNVDLLKKQLEAAKARFDVGEITRTDVSQAEARLASGLAQLTAAEANLVVSRTFYQRTVGEMPGTLDAKPAIPALPESEASALDTAKVQNPALVAAREAEDAAKYSIDNAVGQMLPTVRVSASYGRSGQEYGSETIADDTRLTASASWPLYQGGAEWSGIRQAKELHNKARLDTEFAARSSDERVSNAWEAYRASKASTEANRQQVKASEIAFEGVQQELEVGSRTTLDVLDQQQELLNARVALVRSERDEIVAAYSLLATVGKLTAQELQLPVQVYEPKDNYDMQTWRPLGLATYEN